MDFDELMRAAVSYIIGVGAVLGTDQPAMVIMGFLLVLVRLTYEAIRLFRYIKKDKDA